MEAEVRHLDLDEKVLPPPRWLERELHGEFLLGLGNLLQKRLERGRNRKHPIFSLFRQGDCDLFLGELHRVQRDAGLPNLAAIVQGDFEGRLHAFWVLDTRSLHGDDLRFLKVQLLSGFVLPKFQTDERIG